MYIELSKKFFIGIIALGVLVIPSVKAGPPHHDHHNAGSSGVRLATDIVNLVKSVVEPPVVVAPSPVVVATPAPAPVVVTTPAPAVVVAPAPAPAPAVVIPGGHRPAPRNNPPPRR